MANEYTAKDSTGVMSVIAEIYERTEDATIRDEELLKIVDKWSNSGYSKQAKLLADMHIKEQKGGASESFNILANLDKIESDTDTTKSVLAAPKKYSEERMQTQANQAHEELKLKLASHIEEYNSYANTESSYYQDIEDKKTRSKEISEELSEYANIYEASGDYWSPWNPIGILIGGTTPYAAAQRANPELSQEKRKLDLEAYEMNYGRQALHRNDRFHNMKDMHENSIEDVLYSLNLLEEEGGKTSLTLNEDGTYKNILEDKEIPDYVDPEFGDDPEPTITTRVPGRGY
tara:strand:- start:6178 stop:7047 length:870 start_codon:yes stop_codon:yes gene_type:complete